MTTVTKTVRFDAAHILTNHRGLCKNLHGHTYRVDVSVSADCPCDDMVIDFIRNGLEDVSTVRMLPEVLPLPLNASAGAIREFWKGKEHSQGLVFADAAVLDKNIQVLRSDKPVKFRSPMLDVDGVGFDAYQSRKFLHIRSKVILKIWPAARRQSGIGMERASSGETKSAGDYYEQEIKQQSNTKKKE